MFAAIYHFEVKENKETELIKAWEELTQLIYEYEGSLGSRLHSSGDNSFIAYAQWPNKELWENSGDKLPEQAKEVSKRMKEACIRIETLHELDCVSDLLKSAPK